MVKQSRKLKIADPFLTKSESYSVPILDKPVLRESLKGVEKIFNKERYYFSMLEEDTPAREQQRKKLKKIRRIIKDLNIAIRMEL